MELQVEVLAPCRKKVAVTILPEEIRQAYDEKYKKLNDAVALPGFRPGHAPRRLLEKRFGGALKDEIKQDLVQKAFTSLVEEQKVVPLKTPSVDLEALDLPAAEAFSFQFEILTPPDFELPIYKGLRVEVPPIEITDEDVEAALERLRREQGRREEVTDGVAAEGDVIVLDWVAWDGESVEARDDGVYYPLGRGSLAGFEIPDLDPALTGKGPGHRADFSVHGSPDHPLETLRDRDLKLAVTLRRVYRDTLPALDAAFLERLDYESEDELRQDMRKKLERAMTRVRHRAIERRLVAVLAERAGIQIPDEMLGERVGRFLASKRLELKDIGFPEEEVEPALEKFMAEEGESGVLSDLKAGFLLDRIADAEAIHPTERQMSQAIIELAERTGVQPPDLLHHLQGTRQFAEFQRQIRHDLTREALREGARIQEAAPGGAQEIRVLDDSPAQGPEATPSEA